jgi:hypothetical protein
MNTIEATEQLSFKETSLIAHSLGINLYNAKVSKKKKDKKLPTSFYRNYFCASPGHTDYVTLDSLEKRGILHKWQQYTNIYFGVTEMGIAIFKQEFKRHTAPEPSKV